VSVDPSVVGKALAAACAELREGDAGDAIGATEAAGGTGVDVEADGTAAAGGANSGVIPTFVAAPASTEEAAAVLRAAAEHDLAVVPRGGGSRLGWGPPPARCDVLVDMTRMDAVIEHAAGDLVARMQAGARMGDVAAVLAAAGQEIALDVPDGATAGGVVASGLAGPRRLRYGSPRDLLIGITIVRADGTVARSGGKVVKNVAGYDLGKLFAGSAGTLGLITEVTFRLHPLPGARAFVTAEFAAAPAASDAVAAAANSALVASAVELSRPSPGGPLRVAVLLEGSADGVSARAQGVAGLLASATPEAAPEVAEAAPPWWPGPPAGADGETLVRVSFWVSALRRMLDTIDTAAGDARLSPAVAGSAGAGVLYLRFAADAPADRIAGFAGALRDSLDQGRGGVVVLAAPADVRVALAVSGGMAGHVPGLSLMRAVKDQFDPGHRMSPGRFPEVI
jgi:glycolate oxidase FAD binding subunit